MHILLEEAPLLVFYFLTLFLSNCKLRLILSIFWTTSTFCQLALPSLRCGHFAAPFGHSAPFGRSLRSLRSRLALVLKAPLARYKQTLTAFVLVYSLVPSISIAPCEFAFRFTQYNSRSCGRPSDTFLNVHSLC